MTLFDVQVLKGKLPQDLGPGGKNPGYWRRVQRDRGTSGIGMAPCTRRRRHPHSWD